VTDGAATRAMGGGLQTLDVFLGATRVGTIAHLGNEALIFTFDRAYVE
jgi:hypothetical protein